MMLVDDCEDGANGCPHVAAAFGWCAPTETIYGMPSHELYTPNVTKSVPLPDIHATRGGIRHDLPTWGEKQEI